MDKSRICLLLAFLSLVCSLGGCQQNLVENHQPTADLVLLNGIIYTLDENHPQVEAIAIKDGKFLHIGSNADIESLIGPETKISDLNRHFVMPGINDAHIHPLYGGLQTLFKCEFAFTANPDQVKHALKQCIDKNPEAEWILGGQWTSDFFVNHAIGSPRQWLDQITENKAIKLIDDSHHNAWVNSKALQLAGIDKHTPDPKGGTIVRDPKTGEATGLLLETATHLVKAVIPDWSAEQYFAAAQAATAIASQYGITGIKDANTKPPILKSYQQLDEAQQLHLHVAASIATPYGHRDAPLNLDFIEQQRTQHRSRHLHPDFVKLFMDGVPTASRTAAMLAPYLPDKHHGHNYRGQAHIPQDILVKDLIALDKKGITVKIHTAGDGAVRQVLDALDQVRQTNGNSHLRHELAHAGYIAPQDLRRFQQLNIVADLSPYLWHPSPIIDSIVNAVGERGKQYWPIRDLLDSGAPIAAGSDWPAAVPSANPWPGIEAMVSRRDPYGKHPGELWAPQAVSLPEALKIYTLNGAKALKLEQVTGSISVGKSADFIVLDRNLFEIPTDAISDTQTLVTYFEGQPVYTRPQLN